jgi:hyperosmotically inducible periplasmic protein
MQKELTLKQYRFVTIAIVLTASFTAVTTAVKDVSAQRPRLSSNSRESRDRARANLIKEVRHELVMLPYYGVFDWLQFDVRGDGLVVLRGQVNRPTLKSDAANVVKKIEGVTNVVNQIEVLPLSPNDDRIRRAVYRTLFDNNSPLYRYGLGAVPSIHIIVKNGNVTLKGIVDRQSDADLANIRTNGVSGVFSVKNELTVGNNRRK